MKKAENVFWFAVYTYILFLRCILSTIHTIDYQQNILTKLILANNLSECFEMNICMTLFLKIDLS